MSAAPKEKGNEMLLEVRDLNAFYGDSHILHAISLTIADNARVAVLGRNGAGKSTLLKAIMNAGPATRGTLSWDGCDLGRLSTFERARLGIAFVPEDRRIFTHISVAENIAMARFSATSERPVVPVQEVLERFPLLKPLAERGGGQLSGGQQQIVAVARAMAMRPRLMLLDEPTEGLAPVIVEAMAQDVIRTCDASNASLLLSEQNIWFARACTNYLHVIDSGRIVFSGSWAEFDSNKEIAQKYLTV